MPKQEPPLHLVSKLPKMRAALESVIFLCSLIMSVFPDAALAAAEKKPNALLVVQKHQLFGPGEVYMSKDWLLVENLREGTTFIRKKDSPTFYCFNRKRRVYFRGTGSAMLKRMELMSVFSGNKEGIKWDDASWAPISQRPRKMFGVTIKEFVYKKKNWHMLVAPTLEIPPSIYKDYLEFSRLPQVGAMPLSLFRMDGNRRGLEILRTSEIKKVYLPPERLEIPKGSKIVKDLYDVSSDRTNQLMEEFADILGD